MNSTTGPTDRRRLPMAKAVTQIEGDAVASLVRAAQVPVLVEFSAKWCAPCRRQAARTAAVARRMGPLAACYRVDIEAGRKAASRFNILSVPTLIIFAGGAERVRYVGIQPSATVVAALRRLAAPPVLPKSESKIV